MMKKSIVLVAALTLGLGLTGCAVDQTAGDHDLPPAQARVASDETVGPSGDPPASGVTAPAGKPGDDPAGYRMC